MWSPGGAMLVFLFMLFGCSFSEDDASYGRVHVNTIELAPFIVWFSPENAAEVQKRSQQGLLQVNELKEKFTEYFNELPLENQTSVAIALKKVCLDSFGPFLSEAELTTLKIALDNGHDKSVRIILKRIISRFTEHKLRNRARIAISMCSDITKLKLAKRSVDVHLEKNLRWLTPEQKKEIEEMSNTGASKEELKKKLMSYITETSKDPVKKQKTIKDCYNWMETVASVKEINELSKLHLTDHAACKIKVREFIERLPAEKKEEVLKSLPHCEILWYEEHYSLNHGHHRHLRYELHKHNAREHYYKRLDTTGKSKRHLSVIIDLFPWLNPDQKKELEELENKGENFSVTLDRLFDFQNQLDLSRKDNVTSDFKEKCSRWAKEVSKPAEWDQIKSYYAKKDYVRLREMLRELEFRLTENQMHMIEHVRSLCYRLWGIVHPARLIRATSMEERFKWLSEGKRQELRKLYEGGSYNELVQALNFSYIATFGEDRKEATEALRQVCHDATRKTFGDERYNEFEALKKMSASAEDYSALSKKALDALPADVKPKGKAVLDVCEIAYQLVTRRKRNAVTDPELNWERYFGWATDNVNNLKDLMVSGNIVDFVTEIDYLYSQIPDIYQDIAHKSLILACDELKYEAFGVNARQFNELTEQEAKSRDYLRHAWYLMESMPFNQSMKAFMVTKICDIAYAPRPLRTVLGAEERLSRVLGLKNTQILYGLRDADRFDEYLYFFTKLYDLQTGGGKTILHNIFVQECIDMRARQGYNLWRNYVMVNRTFVNYEKMLGGTYKLLGDRQYTNTSRIDYLLSAHDSHIRVGYNTSLIEDYVAMMEIYRSEYLCRMMEDQNWLNGTGVISRPTTDNVNLFLNKILAILYPDEDEMESKLKEFRQKNNITMISDWLISKVRSFDLHTMTQNVETLNIACSFDLGKMFFYDIAAKKILMTKSNSDFETRKSILIDYYGRTRDAMFQNTYKFCAYVAFFAINHYDPMHDPYLERVKLPISRPWTSYPLPTAREVQIFHRNNSDAWQPESIRLTNIHIVEDPGKEYEGPIDETHFKQLIVN